jgi:hypothetical protein
MPQHSVHEIANSDSRRPFGGRLVACCVLLGATAGCPSPDAEGKYKWYVDETKEQRDEFQGMRQDVAGALADISGDHLFVLASVIAPELPLQFITTVAFTDAGDGTAVMDISFQPLSLTPGSTTEPREPVGESLDFTGVPIDAGGAFTVDLGAVEVTGMANPITGSDIAATLVITAAIQSTELYCGTVDGMVTSPLTAPLAGSTFAAVRLDSTDPASLPGAPGQPEMLSSCPTNGGGTEDETGGDTDG